MENYGKTDIKNLMAEYERNLPLSSMAISYLFDVGVQKVKEVSPEEYAAGVDAAIAEAESCGSKYFLIVTVKVPKSVMDTVKGYLNAESEDEFQGEDDTITYTAVFPDGKQMDVKCCGCRNEASWTEAVLFDRNGSELCCSEPGDEYAGTWELEYEGTKYVAVVKTEKSKRRKT